MSKMSKSKGDWRWLRDAFNISQLARLLDVDRQVIDNWIRGRNDPDFLSTVKLATLVGSMEELERRANIKIGLTPLESTGSPLPLHVFNDRNYASLLRVAELLKYISRFDEIYAQASKALKEVAGKNKILSARLLFNKGYAELMLGLPLDAIESLDKARKLLPSKVDSVLLADTHWLTGECLRVIGKLSEAYPYLEEAKKVYTRFDAKPSVFQSGPVWLEWDLGRYFAAYGKYDRALDYFERMERVAKDIRLPDAEVIAAWSRGDIAEMRSEFSAGIANYLYSKGIAGLIGDTFWEAMALWRMAEVYRKLGRFGDAIAAAEAARRTFEAIGNKRMMAKVDCVLAASYLQTGKLDKVANLYNHAFEIFSEAEDAPMERSILIGLALADLAYESQKPKPHYRKSLQALMEIEMHYTNLDDPYLATYNDLAYAEALRLAGYRERALTRFDNVINTSNKYGYQLEKAHALLGIAATKLLGGEADRHSCQDAFKIYQKVGSSWGQVKAFVTQALIASEIGDTSAHWLQQASMLARENSLFVESQLIETLKTQDSRQKEHHVLLFLQAV
jgi:tetratricopeptide (TPR) repeat protein